MSERTTKENERSTSENACPKCGGVDNGSLEFSSCMCGLKSAVTLEQFLAECERGYLSLEAALPDMQKLLAIIRVQNKFIKQCAGNNSPHIPWPNVAREAQAQVRGIVNDSNEM